MALAHLALSRVAFGEREYERARDLAVRPVSMLVAWHLRWDGLRSTPMPRERG